MTAIRRRRTVIVAGIVLASLLLFGCDFFDGLSDGDTKTERDRVREALEREEREALVTQQYEAETDQVLAAGNVLSVRVNYGKSGASQCQVRIDNDRNGWYDYVEDMSHASGSSLGTDEKPFGDYPFGSENFNRQLTDTENHDPKDAVGEYRVTVTADTGYSRYATVKWDGERFTPNLLSFSLD